VGDHFAGRAEVDARDVEGALLGMEEGPDAGEVAQSRDLRRVPIAADTIELHRVEYPHHARAREQIRQLAEGSAAWALPWACVHEFLAVTKNPRVFRVPLKPRQSADAIDALLESPTAVLISEGPGYWETLRALVEEGGIAGPPSVSIGTVSGPKPKSTKAARSRWRFSGVSEKKTSTSFVNRGKP
jgi:hypothetical protein